MLAQAKMLGLGADDNATGAVVAVNTRQQEFSARTVGSCVPTAPRIPLGWKSCRSPWWFALEAREAAVGPDPGPGGIHGHTVSTSRLIHERIALAQDCEPLAWFAIGWIVAAARS